MRFVVDETSFDFNGVPESTCIEIIESMLDRMEDAIEGGHDCLYSDQLFIDPVLRDKSLWELCSRGEDVHIPHEVSSRIAAVFNNLTRWQELPQSNIECSEVSINGGQVEVASSIAYAHSRSLLGVQEFVACISCAGRVCGEEVVVTVEGVSSALWFVAAERDAELLCRWMILRATTTPAELEFYANSAFKNLDFLEGVFGGIKSMSKPYMSLLPKIVQHLGALSDDGQRIFRGEYVRVSAEFGPLGVDISDENGNTKRNSVAVNERKKVWRDEERYFWWHTKFERDRDRIHLCPRDVSAGGKILVGIFCTHLTT